MNSIEVQLVADFTDQSIESKRKYIRIMELVKLMMKLDIIKNVWWVDKDNPKHKVQVGRNL